MFEVEQKFHVDEIDQLLQSLAEMGATDQGCQQHQDTYYNHPCRDFAESREALRVRRVDGIPMVTYKGRPLPGAIKARKELEWRLDPGDTDGSKTEMLLTLLSFRKVATVQKRRRMFTLPGDWADCTVVLDRVEQLGDFAEIELIVAESSNIELARQRISDLSTQLGLVRGEKRSYLTMLLESDNSHIGSPDN